MECFEKWYAGYCDDEPCHPRFDKDIHGYTDMHTALAWNAWQAAIQEKPSTEKQRLWEEFLIKHFNGFSLTDKSPEQAEKVRRTLEALRSVFWGKNNHA